MGRLEGSEGVPLRSYPSHPKVQQEMNPMGDPAAVESSKIQWR